jgi:mannose-6-phosphate isomerase-like protein (cupin superfamily)
LPDAVAPDGSEVYFRALDATRASLVEIVLRPGGTSRPVRHRTVEEVWYVLAGAGEVWLRSPDRTTAKTRKVQRGEVVVIPAGWDFQFRAVATEELRFLCFTVPPWPGEEEAIAVLDGGLGEPTV